MAYPRPDRLYALIVDASTGTATIPGKIGFILAQTDENQKFHVISYGSRQLVDAEKKYSPYLLEMQAAVEGMKHYDNNLRWCKFVLYTDHRPLEKLGHLHTKLLNRLQQAMLDYDFTIQYKKGINMPDDFLSRQTVDHLSAIDPFSPDLAKLQAAENDIICLKHFSKHASWLQGTPKSPTNCLAPLVSKNLSQEYTLWIRLSDSNRPCTALFLPGRFWKRAVWGSRRHTFWSWCWAQNLHLTHRPLLLAVD